uniref:Uncharacterized protein n=1 Tax=Anguilla anguilla TaxID=7936 RepID=A0A0E9TB46_ANGAN
MENAFSKTLNLQVFKKVVTWGYYCYYICNQNVY